MNTVFADAYFYIALMSPRDAGHVKARAAMEGFSGQMVPSRWVLLEVADAFCSPKDRPKFSHLLTTLTADPRVTIIDVAPAQFHAAVELYGNRVDKQWSLTDCLSFLIMKDKQLTEALTGDVHFEQAGFVAMLRR